MTVPAAHITYRASFTVILTDDHCPLALEVGDGVALGSDVTVTFDEPVVPLTDWDSAVTLRAVGVGQRRAGGGHGGRRCLTLDPADDLARSTVYTVTVDGDVANASGIPLGADDTWSFTTSAPLWFVVDETAADFGEGSDAGTSVSVTGDGEVILAPTVGSGTFTSRVLDAGELADWRTLEVTDTTPSGTSISYEVRTGDTTDPDDGTWSAFTPLVDGADVPGMSRYAQYRATLNTTVPGSSPWSRGSPSATSRAAAPPSWAEPRRSPRVTPAPVELQIPVRLSAPSGATVRVNWTTMPSAGLVPGEDYALGQRHPDLRPR